MYEIVLRYVDGHAAHENQCMEAAILHVRYVAFLFCFLEFCCRGRAKKRIDCEAGSHSRAVTRRYVGAVLL